MKSGVKEWKYGLYYLTPYTHTPPAVKLKPCSAKKSCFLMWEMLFFLFWGVFVWIFAVANIVWKVQNGRF